MDKVEQEAEWTILMYANGNNELEPEMQQAMLDAEKAGSSGDVHVVIQIGRAEHQLVDLIRHSVKPNVHDGWSGVRRYFVNKGHSELKENLGKVNMADSRQLYLFIKWGMLSYPAKKYMLILGGHSYHCVGLMTDYGGSAPYIMGIPEMVRAINTAGNETDKKIDCLLLDACCSNSLELLYEFGKDENHAVQSVITYRVNGPIEGLPYDRLIRFLQKNSREEANAALIKNIIEELSYHLVAFEINYEKLRRIKQLFHDKTSEFLSKSAGDGRAPGKIPVSEQKKILQYVSENSPSIVLYSKKNPYCHGSLLTVTAGFTGNFKLLARYYRLGFAQDNCWASLLSDKPADADTGGITAAQKESLLPLEMSPQEVYEGISVMNPDLEESQKSRMLKELYQFKKWAL